MTICSTQIKCSIEIQLFTVWEGGTPYVKYPTAVGHYSTPPPYVKYQRQSVTPLHRTALCEVPTAVGHSVKFLEIPTLASQGLIVLFYVIGIYIVKHHPIAPFCLIGIYIVEYHPHK